MVIGRGNPKAHESFRTGASSRCGWVYLLYPTNAYGDAGMALTGRYARNMPVCKRLDEN